MGNHSSKKISTNGVRVVIGIRSSGKTGVSHHAFALFSILVPS